jgi:tetratricopeptide (TPR) repeat protein
VYQLQGKFNDAVEEYEATIKECDADPPDEDSRHIRGQLLLDIYKALSSVYTRIGRMTQSVKVLREGVDKLEKLFGANSFQTLQLLDVCAAEYYEQEDYEQAEALCKWIVSAQIQTLGIDHAGTMHAQEKLARVYFQLGKFQLAEAICIQCLDGLERNLGLEHPTTLNQVVFLGRIYTKLHKFLPAEEALRRAVSSYEKILGPQHPETLNAREELALCYETQNKLKEAHAVYMQVMFGREDSKDPKIRETLRRLLPLMEKLGMKEEARQLMKQWSEGFGGL